MILSVKPERHAWEHVVEETVNTNTTYSGQKSTVSLLWFYLEKQSSIMRILEKQKNERNQIQDNDSMNQSPYSRMGSH